MCIIKCKSSILLQKGHSVHKHISDKNALWSCSPEKLAHKASVPVSCHQQVPSLCRLICSFYESSLASLSHPVSMLWMKAKQKAVLPGCFSQPNSSELLDTAVRVDLGVHSVPGSWQMLQPSFNPKAAGYIFHWKKVILRKSIRGNTEVRFLTQF